MPETKLFDQMVELLKAMAEHTRLRILALLSQGDLSVSDLTAVLEQSQPRVSRHLRLLYEAGLVERYQEGAWAYFRLSKLCQDMGLREIIFDPLYDSLPLQQDGAKLVVIKQQRRQKAEAYFSSIAPEWEKLRQMHISDQALEQRLKEIVGQEPIQMMLDIGTGTGAMLQLFSHLYVEGVGVDINAEMLRVARSNLEKMGVLHAKLRQADSISLPFKQDSFDLITIHQVLHFLEDPAFALKEAARVMRPQARLIIVDFATHDVEDLRDNYAHLRLGFDDEQIAMWLEQAGLEYLSATAIAPMEGTRPQTPLTIKIWVARDRRWLLA